jgi:hypothetical protein
LPPEIEHHLGDLRVVREFLTQLRFGPGHEEIRILILGEEKDQAKLAAQKSKLISAFPEAGETFFLSPARQSSTRELFYQILKPRS